MAGMAPIGLAKVKVETGTVVGRGGGGGIAPPVSVLNVVTRRMATAEIIDPFRECAV